MTVKLQSAATGDLVLLNALAHVLLGALGKTAEAPGILEPQDMAQALAVLKALPDETPPTVEGDEVEAPAFSDEAVSLRKRAWPLIQMIERAQAEGKPIVWGV